jgi:hypothetical protein
MRFYLNFSYIGVDFGLKKAHNIPACLGGM